MLIGCGAAGGLVGLVAGALVGLLLAITGVRGNRNRTIGARVGATYRLVSGVGTLGLVSGVGIGVIVAYTLSVREGPPHGYPDRPAYRAAEMADRSKRLEPVLAALEKYRADHGRYPARLADLVDGKYVDALPPVKLEIDHLGQPGRVTTILEWYWYSAPQAGDEFALRAECVFTEDLDNAMPLRVSRVYRSRTPGWNEGSVPPWPQPAPAAGNLKVGGDVKAEVAPPPREVKPKP